MIINIRGTSGSGKSTTVRKLMEMFPTLPVMSKGVIIGYRIDTDWGPLFAVGKYETPCGGCDGIKTQDEVCARIRKFAKKGHVIFEGLIVTDCPARYKKLLPTLGQPYNFCFLIAPLKTCIRRVEKRRRDRGNTKPLDPTNTTQKWVRNAKAFDKFIEEGFPVTRMNWRDPVSDVIELLKAHPWKEKAK